jgi:tetratricopeptide (TPR) repeat protein
MPIRHEAFYFDRGMCYHLNRQFTEATLDFSTFVKSSSENTDGWLLLAESSLFTEDFAMAKMAATQFLRKEPDNCAAKFIKGCAFLYANKRHKASRCFQEAIGLDPSFEWPKVYSFVVFGIASESLSLPKCFNKNSDNNLVLLPSNPFEEWVFDWHCTHIMELK